LFSDACITEDDRPRRGKFLAVRRFVRLAAKSLSADHQIAPYLAGSNRPKAEVASFGKRTLREDWLTYAARRLAELEARL